MPGIEPTTSRLLSVCPYRATTIYILKKIKGMDSSGKGGRVLEIHLRLGLYALPLSYIGNLGVERYL